MSAETLRTVFPSEMATPLSHLGDDTKEGSVSRDMIPAGRKGSEEDSEYDFMSRG